MKIDRATFGAYVALAVLVVGAAIGLYALVSYLSAGAANVPGNYCIPNTSQCITPAVPLYCNRYEYVCITAIPADSK